MGAYINGREVFFSPIINISEAPEVKQLATPYVSISTSGVATWGAVTNAKEYSYEIYNGTTLVKAATTTITAVTLESGQSIKVMAVGDGVNYNNSAWSIKKTYAKTIRLYFGVGSVTGETDNPFTSAFITSLTYNNNYTSRVCSFTVAPATQYIYFAAPKSNCIDSNGNDATVFTVNNFSGGFLAPQTLAINGVDYYIYRSVQKLTGNVTVNVT